MGKTLITHVKWEWDTLDDWASALESNGISINAAPQTARPRCRSPIGAIEDRPATLDEMREMKRLAAEMEMGAFSLSTGLSVAPSGYATTDDVRRCARR